MSAESLAEAAIRRTGVKGVLNSWLSIARNWSLARLAPSAKSFASRKSSSFLFLSSISVHVPNHLTIRPASSLTSSPRTRNQR